MRLADLLVDLAAVASASRSVAAKHVALRARQLERYSRGSSVVAAVLRARAQAQAQAQTQTQTQTGARASGEEQGARREKEQRDAETETEGQRERPVQAQEGEQGGGVRDGAVQASAGERAETASAGGGDGCVREQAAEAGDGGGDAQGGAPARAGRPGEEVKKSEFVPAPWADGGIAMLKHGFGHPPRTPPIAGKAKKKPVVELPGGQGAAAGIDLNVFRTSRGSRILEALQQAEEKDPAQQPAAAQLGGGEGGTRPTRPEKAAEGVRVSEEKPEPARSPAAENAVPETPAEDTVQHGQGEKAPPSPSPQIRARPATEEPAQTTLSRGDAELVADLTGSAPASSGASAYQLRESRVPSSRISRLWNYGGLAAGMVAGAIGEGLSRAVGGGGSGSGSLMLNASNMERLVARLSRMRGAALKLGQMMSFQDAKMLPAPIQEVLQRVQDRADYMPAWQRDRVLAANLGAGWRDLFDEFEDKPIAAASIGQVHRATLRSGGARVAVKIQFPGVADSINSDLDNLSLLLAATKLLPRGLYLDKTIDNARTELAWECDYEREAECAERYRRLLAPSAEGGSDGDDDDDVFAVPRVYREASGKQVLTMEFMSGTAVTRIGNFTQAQRDWIGTQILRLCLREITEFRFMQTDPNWTNFLYNAATGRLELLDFGASREYPAGFVRVYVRLLEAASRADRAAVRALSEELGYLTGHESRAMLDAHVTSVLTLAEPFRRGAPALYDFRGQTITDRVKAQIPVMIHERLAPPPEETYSLHRKLSGAFLLCARLGSRVPCRQLFVDALRKTGYLDE